ncbi:MAG: hypothetical protein PHE78_02250 [Candidatus Gastranaerophilales bacterium]|jgi:hypothetical protein|nr:hypothetical protein [Candidatus Gastranaerophilales bacterium]
MVSQLASFIGNQLTQSQQSPQQLPVKEVKPAIQKVGNPNPFNGNPFVTAGISNDNQTFGKNMPVPGGFFAGYHNGKPNIVGANLFVEI